MDEAKTDNESLVKRAVAAGVPRVAARAFIQSLDAKYLPALESAKTTKDFAVQYSKLLAMRADREAKSKPEADVESTEAETPKAPDPVPTKPRRTR